MTEAQALRIICEAALLADTEAASILRQHYSALPYDHDCKREFLLALAWLNPEEARALMPELGFWAHTVETRITHLCEAQALNEGTAEGFVAYRTMTALLPQQPLPLAPRLQVQHYALALRDPEQYVSRIELYRDQRDLFLIARLWQRYTEAFWEKAIAHDSAKVLAIGRFVLAQKPEPEGLPALIALFFKSSKEYLEGMNAEQEYEALLYAMQAFEEATPAHQGRLAPQALAALIPQPEKATATLAARILCAAAQAGCDSGTVFYRVLECGDGEPLRGLSHWWAAQVQKAVAIREPTVPAALEQARILRAFAMIQLLGNHLYKESDQRRINRAWRWLQRSGRLIGSVEDLFWREQLHRKRQALETQIRSSRRKKHIIARKVGES